MTGKGKGELRSLLSRSRVGNGWDYYIGRCLFFTIIADLNSDFSPFLMSEFQDVFYHEMMSRVNFVLEG